MEYINIDINKLLKDKKKVAIASAAAGLLLLSIILIFAYSFLSGPQEDLNSQKAADEIIGRLESLIASINSKRSSIDNKGIIGTLPLDKKPEPAKKVVKEKNTAETLSLIGIIWDENEPLALIDDQLLVVGEYINGLMLINITEESIILLDEKGKRWEIRLL